MRSLKLVGLFSLLSFVSFAQVGGQATYQFLNLVSSPRAAALGGAFVPTVSNDAGLTYLNPSLLNAEMNNTLVVNYVNYVSDINYGFAGYVKDYGKIGTFSAGLKYFHYGEFIKADETSAILGEFNVQETALNIGWGKALREKLRVGANLKLIYSNLYQYNSVGAAIDVSGLYYDKEKTFGVSFVAKNIGSQITTYTIDNFEPLPFEIQIGLSKRLKHAPFQFIVLAHNLEKSGLWYENNEDKLQNTSLFSNDTVQESSHLGDEIFRHITLGVEFIPTENFKLRAGYNHQRRQELQLGGDNKTGMVGFSFGAEISIKKLTFQYGFASYHLGGSSNHISLIIALDKNKNLEKVPAKE